MQPDNLNKAVKRARIAKGISQRELAELVYQPASAEELLSKTMFISGMERGAFKVPDTALKDLARVLDLKLSQLIDFKIAEYRAKLTAKCQ